MQEPAQDRIVRVYQPQVTWILLLASQLNAGDPVRERAFKAVLEGRVAIQMPLTEARRRRL